VNVKRKPKLREWVYVCDGHRQGEIGYFYDERPLGDTGRTVALVEFDDEMAYLDPDDIRFHACEGCDPEGF